MTLIICDTNFFPLQNSFNPCNLHSDNSEDVQALYNSLAGDGYDPKHPLVLVEAEDASNEFEVLDGNHRYTLLLDCPVI